MPAPAPPAAGGKNLSTWLSVVAVVLAAGALVASVAIPGPTGPTGAQGNQGSTGNTGPQGPAGANYSVNATLRPGQSETGVYGDFGSGTSLYYGEGVTFKVPLAADIDAANVTFIAQGGTTTTACPGVGHAAPGHLCVYEQYASQSSFGDVANPTTGSSGVSKYGFVIWFTSTTAGSSWSYGTYTVTAI